MGVRLDWDVLSFGNSPKMMWRMARPYLPGVIAALGLTVLVYALAVRESDGGASAPRAGASANPPGRGVWYALASFVLLGALGLVVANPDKAEGQAGVRLVQTSPLWKRVANRPSAARNSCAQPGRWGWAILRRRAGLIPRRRAGI